MNNQPTDQPESNEWVDRRTDRWQRREARRAARGVSGLRGAWIGGAMLVILGIILLLQNLNIFTFDNWWALFILLPAVGSFAAAWRSYHEEGQRLTVRGRGALIGGFIFTMLSAVFLFNLNIEIFGPALMVLAGIGLIVNFFIAG